MILSFGSVIISILAFVFALGLIILIHEGGHFFFARKAKILCREYAFGMGPQLLKVKKGETTYSLRAFPIGGFCAIAGEEQEADPLKDLQEVKLLLENGIVTKIIFEDKDNIYDEAKVYQIVNYDLFDKDDTGHLFITVKGETEEEGNIELPVDPQAMYVMAKPVKNKELSKEKQKKRYAEEIQIAPHNRTLNAKSKTARALVMVGGPLMNFVLAVVVFFIAGLISGFAYTKSTQLGEVGEGTPAYVADLKADDIITHLSTTTTDGQVINSGDLEKWDGISKFMDEYKANPNATGNIVVTYTRDGETKTTEITPAVIIYSISMIQDTTDSVNVKIAELAKKSQAYIGGLRTGDIITDIRFDEFESQNVAITSWKQVYQIFSGNIKGDKMVITVNRDGKKVECTVDPYSEKLFKKTQNVGITAILMGISPQTKFNFGKSIVYSFTEVGHSVKNMFNTLISKEVGIKDLSGPIGIFSMTSNAVKGGFASLLNWIGFLSVNIGFLNLLPIPALDGGRLVFVAYEAITKKKPSEKVETALISITMILLLGLIIFVSFNDILRLLGVK